MSDLTVLVSPTPLYPRQHSLTFSFARQSQNDLTTTRPVMVTLESVDSDEEPSSPVQVRALNEALLSPPRNTFKAARTSSARSPQRPSVPPLRVPSSTGISDPESVAPPSRKISGRVFSSFAPTNRSELSRPPPPLFRPTTFWRKTKRSGVTGASYSPSSHLIRRSTFIAAGLSLDKPEADLSALCVESRVSLVVLGPNHSVQ
ncbi:hypothetical protein PAXRUDRAFT_782392 [Paxillus rubicundulus Ve08.2h10]|uniref:Uncharacterized protein n=1 Tax=Paxillus rubicundulus Ve08.2h10 TaxID=930991 RepID=A0A0D0DX65_9AGAM|nr:hypothetical protein PAXRUDRAFT_782392 [Paxillus rubicundulus Ve08.2h10]